MIRLGQIGAGIWGSNLLRNFACAKGAKMVVCCDKDGRKLERVRSLYPEIEITTDDTTLYKRPDIDALIIATPPSTHGELARLALENGKHVFVEKPVALKIEDAVKIRDIAEKKKLVLMVGHLLLHHPAVKALKKIVDSGELGKVFYMYSARLNLGQVRLEENALWSLAPHDISVALYLLGTMPAEVTAWGKSYLQPDVEDVIFMSLKFSGDIIYNVQVSWLDPHKIRKFTIVGSKKMAVFDDMEKKEKIKIYDKGVEKIDYNAEKVFTYREGEVHAPAVGLEEPLKIECEHFIESIKEGHKPITDGNNGIDVLRVLEAAQESLKNGGIPVKVKKV